MKSQFAENRSNLTRLINSNVLTVRPSLNAVAQALKLAGVPRADLLNWMGIPRCQTSQMRYVEEAYNIKPWSDRSDAERQAAKWVAIHHLQTCTRA